MASTFDAFTPSSLSAPNHETDTNIAFSPSSLGNNNTSVNASSPRSSSESRTRGGINGDENNTYDKMVKSLQHASNEKSLMLQEIQKLKTELKNSKKRENEANDAAKELAKTNELLAKENANALRKLQVASPSPALNESLVAQCGTVATVVASKELLSLNKLLEANLRTGKYMLSTLKNMM